MSIRDAAFAITELYMHNRIVNYFRGAFNPSRPRGAEIVRL